MEKHYTNYVEWLESDARRHARNWAVTYELTSDEWTCTAPRCEILQWEDSNCKWYRLLPFEQREEAGCYWEIWAPHQPKGHRNSKILSVGPV